MVSAPAAEQIAGVENESHEDLLATQRGCCSLSWAALAPCARPRDSPCARPRDSSTTAAEWEPPVRGRKPAHALVHASVCAAGSLP